MAGQKFMGVTVLAILILASSINAGDDNGENGEKKVEVVQVNGTLLEFVLSARELAPRKGLFGSSNPDTYVEMEYIEKKGDDEAQSHKTGTVIKNSNPEWPNIMKVTFHDGQGQRIKFIVRDRVGNEMGHVSTSVKNLVKAERNKLELELIGSNQKNGRLIIETLINNDVNDDTDERLAVKKKKSSLVLDLDKLPKKGKGKKKKSKEDEDDD